MRVRRVTNVTSWGTHCPLPVTGGMMFPSCHARQCSEAVSPGREVKCRGRSRPAWALPAATAPKRLLHMQSVLWAKSLRPHAICLILVSRFALNTSINASPSLMPPASTPLQPLARSWHSPCAWCSSSVSRVRAAFSSSRRSSNSWCFLTTCAVSSFLQLNSFSKRE